MINTIIALIYLTASIAGGWALALVCFPAQKEIIHRVAAGWWFVTFLMLFSPHPFIWYAGSAVALLALCPKSVPDRLLFYCALLPAAPLYLGWQIPFPGISYLIRLYYPTFLNLVLLLPLLFIKPGKDEILQSKHQRIAIYIAIAFVVLSSLLDFRETTVTNGLRLAFDQFISMGLIILVFSRARSYPEAAPKILFGLFLGGSILVFIGIMQSVQGWLIYSEASQLVLTVLNYQHWMEWRGGELRIPGTMNAIPFGVYMGLCLAITAYYLRHEQVTKWGWLFVVLFVYALEKSGSRGAILMVGIILMCYLGLFSERGWLKYLTYTGVISFFLLLMTTNLGDMLVEGEEHGTLAYRVDLVANSMDSITNNFTFGTPNYIENEALQASYQGQGIIDIVNAYLQIILRYGMVGLLLYVLPMRYALKHVNNNRRTLLLEQDPSGEHVQRLAASLLVGFAVMIISVSLVDRMSQYFWILTFLCCVFPGSEAPVKPKISFAR